MLATQDLLASLGRSGCTNFAPLSLSAALVLRPRSGPASVLVAQPPGAPAGTSLVLGAVLEPDHGPAGTIAAPLRIAPNASTYLDDDYPVAALRLQWSGTSTLVLCGLVPRQASFARSPANLSASHKHLPAGHGSAVYGAATKGG